MQVASVKNEESEENVGDEVDVVDEEGEVVGLVVNSQMAMLRSRFAYSKIRVLVEHMYCI